MRTASEVATDWRVWWWLGFIPIGIPAAWCWWLYATEPTLSLFGLGAFSGAAVFWLIARGKIEWHEAEALREILGSRHPISEAERARTAAELGALMTQLHEHVAAAAAQSAALRAVIDQRYGS